MVSRVRDRSQDSFLYYGVSVSFRVQRLEGPVVGPTRRVRFFLTSRVGSYAIRVVGYYTGSYGPVPVGDSNLGYHQRLK